MKFFLGFLFCVIFCFISKNQQTIVHAQMKQLKVHYRKTWSYIKKL